MPKVTGAKYYSTEWKVLDIGHQARCIMGYHKRSIHFWLVFCLILFFWLCFQCDSCLHQDNNFQSQTILIARKGHVMLCRRIHLACLWTERNVKEKETLMRNLLESKNIKYMKDNCFKIKCQNVIKILIFKFEICNSNRSKQNVPTGMICWGYLIWNLTEPGANCRFLSAAYTILF